MAQRIKKNPAFNAFMLISLVLLIGIASVLPSNSYAIRIRAEALDMTDEACTQLTEICHQECQLYEDTSWSMFCADDAPCFTICYGYNVICSDPTDLCCLTLDPCCGSDDPCCGVKGLCCPVN